MKCEYCLTNEATQEDHFYPRKLGGLKSKIINSCQNCNVRKSGHLFWSIESVQDFIQSGEGYGKWFKHRFIQNVTPDYFESIAVILDRKRISPPRPLLDMGRKCKFCGKPSIESRKYCSNSCMQQNARFSHLQRKYE